MNPPWWGVCVRVCVGGESHYNILSVVDLQDTGVGGDHLLLLCFFCSPKTALRSVFFSKLKFLHE